MPEKRDAVEAEPQKLDAKAFTEVPLIFPDSRVVAAYWIELVGLMVSVHLDAE